MASRICHTWKCPSHCAPCSSLRCRGPCVEMVTRPTECCWCMPPHCPAAGLQLLLGAARTLRDNRMQCWQKAVAAASLCSHAVHQGTLLSKAGRCRGTRRSTCESRPCPSNGKPGQQRRRYTPTVPVSAADGMMESRLGVQEQTQLQQTS